ncbi:ABC transporter permease [Chitinasiproducens palmae]|uniref:Putative spermidine/putrescine transport system permease protein n=1 Tax=Chitinasiproducens palmae TaxID=1770053 RepID=A0A1H2PM35_9BURK|nr:ABC transporter permease [Chitinasiproducens palmae]SDV46735.1 putative spermidine/putrescine transport system permease protein [Chitinasiproducens palmae]
MKQHTTGFPVSCVAVAVLVFLAAPILLVFPLALNTSEYLSFPPKGLTLRWVTDVLSDTAWLDSIWLSARVAALATVLTLLLSLLASLALVRERFPFKRLVYAVVLLPMIVPNIIAAIAMFFFFADMPSLGSVASIVLGHAVVSAPIAVIILSSTLQAFDMRLENAAMSLGASRVTAFRRITLPMIAPGLASAFIFAFLTSFDELLIALFLSGTGAQTLPVRIWNAVLFQLDPKIAAVSALLVIVSALTLALASLFSRRGPDAADR